MAVYVDPPSLERCHWIVSVAAAGFQTPVLAINAEPRIAAPVSDGAVMFAGAPEAIDPTAADGVAALEPYAFVAVTSTRTLFPTSAVTGT